MYHPVERGAHSTKETAQKRKRRRGTLGNGACTNMSKFTRINMVAHLSHSVHRAGWQVKMASIEFWIP